jgi:hypothetical protein
MDTLNSLISKFAVLDIMGTLNSLISKFAVLDIMETFTEKQ